MVAEREAAPHAQDLLQRQPSTWRPDEGAADRDDRPVPQGHPCLVPEQALQGQEEVHVAEADAAAAGEGQCNGPYQLSPSVVLAYYVCVANLRPVSCLVRFSSGDFQSDLKLKLCKI